MKLDDYLTECNEVYHTTINPKGPGVIRIHLIPPKKLKAGVPWVTILNGYYLLPLQTSWAVLLKLFIDELNKTEGNPYDSLDGIIDSTINNAKKIFFDTKPEFLKKDLKTMFEVFEDIARGKNPDEEIGFTTLSKYGKYMSAPHRMDLMVSSMSRNGNWGCNQKCLHCYAADEKMSEVEEVDTETWKMIIDKLKEARIPQLTFTGGEPTLRSDLVELIDYSHFFVTRLNTNGIKLTKELCEKLYDASLDSVQITFYSSDKAVHNFLVGGDHFDETIRGIKNAIESKLDVSVNTPLCKLNKNYKNTIEFLHKECGVKFFTCSGLIPSGNATSKESLDTKLSKEEIKGILKEAFKYTKDNGLEISFTSPGWIDDETLLSMKINVPSCGACLSNMAIAPNGTLIPCQSWLFEDGIGNILDSSWNKLWNSKKCKKIRKRSRKFERICPLNREELK